MTPEQAVAEAVQTAFEQNGGTGDAEPVILRGKGEDTARDEDFFYMSGIFG